jgi:ATP-dependent DNA helicase RecG
MFEVIVPLGEVAPQVTGEVTGKVFKLLSALTLPLTRAELQRKLGLKGEDHFRNHYLAPALQADLIEMTIPDKPTSRLQKYRLTAKGRTLLTSLNQKAQP